MTRSGGRQGDYNTSLAKLAVKMLLVVGLQPRFDEMQRGLATGRACSIHKFPPRRCFQALLRVLTQIALHQYHQVQGGIDDVALQVLGRKRLNDNRWRRVIGHRGPR